MHDIQTLMDVVFTKLSLAYGRDFTGRWEGLNMADVKADWAHEMSGYERNPSAIKYALQNLPLKAPNVFEFRSICQRAPEAPTARLEAPAANPEIARKAIAEARALLTRLQS